MTSSGNQITDLLLLSPKVQFTQPYPSIWYCAMFSETFTQFIVLHFVVQAPVAFAAKYNFQFALKQPYRYQINALNKERNTLSSIYSVYCWVSCFIEH